jgi:Flp pilus assembly protein TadD
MVRALALWLIPWVVWCATSPALANLGKGSELMQAERYDEAATQFEEALHKDPALSEARINLAICRFQLRDYAEARKLLIHAKGSLATYYLGRLDLIDSNFDSAIARFQTLRGVRDEQYFLASAYYKKGQFGRAIPPLRAWIRINPRDSRAHQLLARALAKTGNQAEADREFARTKELHEYYAEGSVSIAACRTLLNAGKPAEAWAACEPMLNTDDADKAAAIGMLFGEADDNGHALTAWQKALSLDPESPEVNYNLALAAFHLRDLRTARKHGHIALTLWPEFPEANVLYGTVLYMTGEDAEARRVLTHAGALRPGDATVERLLQELRTP